jgi:plastocyanin
MTMNLQKVAKLFAVVGVVAVCAVFGAPSTRASPPAPTTITVKDFMFTPMSATIKAGATVTWVNEDDEPHTVVSDTGAFRSGALDTHETFSFEFDKPGTYRFACSIHPKMVGTVVVQ